MKNTPAIVSAAITAILVVKINFFSCMISLMFRSNPMMNNKKYIPISARKVKFVELVIASKGLKAARINPRNNDEKTHGIRIFSMNCPPRKVTQNSDDKNINSDMCVS